MSLGALSGLQSSEEERKKRREQFDNNRTNLGFGAKAGQGGLLGSGRLTQQARQQAPVQNQSQSLTQRSPQMATQQAAQERNQALAAKRQSEINQRNNRTANTQQARQDIKEILSLPAREQPNAVANMQSKPPKLGAYQRSAQPSTQGRSTSALTDTAIDAGQIAFRGMPLAMNGADLISGGRVSRELNNVADEMGKLKSTYQAPRQAMSQAGKDGITEQMQDLGMSLKFPMIGKPSNGEDKWNQKDYPSVYASKQSEPADPIANTYTDQPPQTNNAPVQLGFDPVNNPPPMKNTISNGGFGFRMPNAPRRTMSERQEREALLRDASTAYKGSQNGQLTAKQMELRAGIVGANDKYRNDQYGAQLGAASQLTQAQMSQDGANQRAALGEFGSNNRMNAQLGFDAGKFQQTAEQQQQANSLASRRLDIEQNNSDVANFAPKQLNALYEKFDAAQSDEDRSAIAKQIQSLKGTPDKKSKPLVITQTGESPIPGGLGGVKKNPSIIYDQDTGEFINLPKKEVNFSDPEVLAIISNRDLSDEEMESQIAALYS
ncbi:hypothetical protein ACOBWA_01260 [Psychrobacter sp. ER1]|uniref:hypothetical protein n=1 Tax=Psychrobacter sp. ER1 TaxID=3406645 RepID=UPI003B43BC1C